MSQLAKLFVVMVSLMMLNFSFAGQPAGDNNAGAQRNYKEYCVSDAFSYLDLNGVASDAFLVDTNFKEVSEDYVWQSEGYEKAEFIFNSDNIKKDEAKQKCEDLCNKHNGVGDRKLNQCIAYNFLNIGNEWGCYLYREAVAIRGLSSEETCKKSFNVDDSVMILKTNITNDWHYFSKKDHVPYLSLLDFSLVGKVFYVPPSVMFDEQKNELYCEHKNHNCIDDLKDFLMQSSGGVCKNEKVFHLLGENSDDVHEGTRIRCDKCEPRVKYDMDTFESVKVSFLVAFRYDDYMTEYYKTGKKLFVNGACPNGEGPSK